MAKCRVPNAFWGTLLASICIPLVLKMLGSGLHNTPVCGYKEHMKTIPIPNNKQPVVEQPEGTGLSNNKWEPYNPSPIYDEHYIKGVKCYGIKKRSKKERG